MPARKPVKRSSRLDLETVMALQIGMDLSIPAPEREQMLIVGRKFRTDFSWPAHKLILEVEGGIWGKSRHTSGVGFTRDTEKYNALACMGYRVLRVTTDQVHNGQALKWLQQALGTP